jgi:hypothetical protein
VLANGGIHDLAVAQPAEMQASGKLPAGGCEAQAGQRARVMSHKGREIGALPASQRAGGGGTCARLARQTMDDLHLAQGVAGRQCGKVLLLTAAIVLEKLNRALEEEVECLRG